jgi:hypothetical protein
MLGQPGVADGEDADVLAVQPPRRDAVVDARGAQAGAAKLVVRDGAVLMSRDPRDPGVPREGRDRLQPCHAGLR